MSTFNPYLAPSPSEKEPPIFGGTGLSDRMNIGDEASINSQANCRAFGDGVSGVDEAIWIKLLLTLEVPIDKVLDYGIKRCVRHSVEMLEFIFSKCGARLCILWLLLKE